TLNKVLYIKPPKNIYSFNELVALWEKKIESPVPINFFLAINHAIFVKGDHTYFDITPFGVEASELYPDVEYTTVEEYLDKFV
ncbi:Isoflavone reductase-like protein, partial [Sesamum angolense]